VSFGTVHSAWRALNAEPAPVGTGDGGGAGEVGAAAVVTGATGVAVTTTEPPPRRQRAPVDGARQPHVIVRRFRDDHLRVGHLDFRIVIVDAGLD
jgi:hypothetical protein